MSMKLIEIPWSGVFEVIISEGEQIFAFYLSTERKKTQLFEGIFRN